MTIVVVVSALYRMHLYEEAYGFTRLRLLVSVFEGWLGVVVLLLLVAGAVGASHWLVPVAVRLGAASLLGLALVNPDLYIAQHNIARVPRHRSASTGSTWASCRRTPIRPSCAFPTSSSSAPPSVPQSSAMTTGSRGTCPANMPEPRRGPVTRWRAAHPRPLPSRQLRAQRQAARRSGLASLFSTSVRYR